MKRLLICLAAALVCIHAKAQTKKRQLIYGMYLQWGYNAEAYTRSNIHFKLSNGDNFVLHHAKAHDKGDYDDIIKEPGQISIPQYNYRIGFYLNRDLTKGFELNFDHAKYVVTDGQKVHVTGTIGGQHVDGDSVLNPETFLHFEHTDGANWLHLNYFEQKTLAENKAKTRALLTLIYKAGAGINIPRTDFTYHGDRLNNDFHIAGYNIGVEGGLRFYMLKRFFFETTGKTGYVRYIDALANTTTAKGNRATHGIGYLEGIATLGYQFSW
ncbi:hypothetical protein [Parafilimonas sp.]|uniref:hypothetical protein n=1 Tax=Parafilimonas sp. TaxID=1969739 RepID=UPI0039E57608